MDTYAAAHARLTPDQADRAPSRSELAADQHDAWLDANYASRQRRTPPVDFRTALDTAVARHKARQQ